MAVPCGQFCQGGARRVVHGKSSGNTFAHMEAAPPARRDECSRPKGPSQDRQIGERGLTLRYLIRAPRGE